MFAPRYFPNRYFAPRYFPNAGVTLVPNPEIQGRSVRITRVFGEALGVVLASLSLSEILRTQVESAVVVQSRERESSIVRTLADSQER